MNADPRDPSSTSGSEPEEPRSAPRSPSSETPPDGERDRTTGTGPGPSAGTHAQPPAAVVETGRPAEAKADTTKRFVAAVIDGVASVVVGFIPVVGGLAATAYWLTRDGLDVDFMHNRSLGKKVAGLRPITLDGKPVDLETSLKRNWPLAISGIAQILLFIPFIGWLLMLPVALLALVAVVAEAVLVLTDDEGRRFGDKFAGTRVVDAGDAMF